MDKALLRCVELTNGDTKALRTRYPKVFELPFSSKSKLHLTIHASKTKNDNRHLIVMKGAPELVIDACSSILINGIEKKLTNQIREAFISAYWELGGMNEQVLGFCDLVLPLDKYPRGYKFGGSGSFNFPTSGYRFVGLVSMIDPPRAAVPNAVADCRSAGIKGTIIL